MGPRCWEVAASVDAACCMASMRVGPEALLVKRVWRVTTSSLASKIALMSRATLISCIVDTAWLDVMLHVAFAHVF